MDTWLVSCSELALQLVLAMRRPCWINQTFALLDCTWESLEVPINASVMSPSDVLPEASASLDGSQGWLVYRGDAWRNR